MRILTTLPGIVAFQSGTGDADDLVVKVKEDSDGGWFAQVHKGFYYIGTEESYLYASKGEYSFTDTTTGAINTISISGWIIDPTTVGPVIMRRSGQVRFLQRVCSVLRAFRPVTFTGTDPLVATVPSSGLLVSLVSHPVTGILLSVPSTGDIISNEDYYYDQSQGKVYIRATNPPSIFATYLVDEFDSDLLKLEEIHRVGTDNNIRTQFTNVWYASGSALNPTVSKPTSTGLISGNATLVSGNVLTPDSSLGIVSGDIIAVRYYVSDSFTAIPSSSTTVNNLVVKYLLGSSGNFTVDYELGDTWYDTSQVSGTVDFIQLNPILEPRSAAFLYVVDSDEPNPPASTITISSSNLNPLYNPSGCAKVVIAVNVYDAELEPIVNQPVNVSTSGASGLLSLVIPLSGSTSSSSGITNGIGQVLYTWTIQGTGAVHVTASASGFPTASGVLDFIVRDIRYYDQTSELLLGKLMICMEDTPVVGTLRKVNSYYCYRDGSPFAPSGQTTTYFTSVTFDADSSQFYTLDGLPQARPLTVSTNGDSIASILVDPVPGDVIRAFVQTPTAGRIRTAAPIFIPDSQITTR